MKKNGAFLKKLLETFKVEAAEHITAISSGLIELERSPSEERRAEIIETVFRESHSMKGAARAVNLSVVESVCQSLEGVLSALKRGGIVPNSGIVNLLHRSVNVLEALLSESVPSEKTEIRELIDELDNAAKGAHSYNMTGPASAVPVQAPPAEKPAPVLQKVTAETMRISKQRLDSLLLQAEGFLSVKQLMARRDAELRDAIAEAAALGREWGKMRRDAGKIGKRGGVADNAGVRKLKSFLDEKYDQIVKLNDTLLAIGKAAERDSRSVASIADGLMEDMRTMAMVPLASVLEMMPKVVRDLAHDQGKEAVLIENGGEIEIDRRILDEMKEPLIHLVRNCIDHGIEKPQQRSVLNKPSAGTVSISVLHGEGKSVKIVVSDDGSGVDTSKIRSSALRLGLLSAEEAESMDVTRLLPLMFRSGVTTSPIITDLSGRGLGLAIVQEKVEKLGGSVFCETAEGKGTSFCILLPLSLATFRGVVVQTGNRRFIIPTKDVYRTARFGRGEVRTLENRETIVVDDRTMPLVPLRAVLEMPREEKKMARSEFMQAVVVGSAENRIAFGVDDILQEREVLVKDMGRQLVRVRNVAGVTVLATGEIVPVLNVSDLLKSAVKASPYVEARTVTEAEPEAKKSVLVVEDSITARTLLKNIIEAAGYSVQTAVDGVDALTILKSGAFDIVISDIEMPRMSGLDLTARIRAEKRLAELPVVLVTALESREDKERGIDVGANAYIVKSSFDQSNLLEVMRRLL